MLLRLSHAQRVVRRALHRTATRVALLVTGLLVLQAGVADAHEVPPSVVVRTFVKPDGTRLRVLVRVPLDAMRDVEFPLRGAQYLDLSRADETLRDAAKLWVADAIALYADGVRLDAPTIVAARAALPSSRAFASYDEAMASFAGAPLAAVIDLPWKQALLDVQLEYSMAPGATRFAIEAAMANLGVRTTTVMHYLLADGTERVFTYDGDPGLVPLDPGWWQAAWQFVRAGFLHILDGIDHLLFLFCLVIPFRRARPVIALVTAFTVAHSITLVASAAGYAPDALWFPPLIEVLIALSIVYMACENIVGAKIERRWPVAFAFGLVHGFGFSFALRDTMQFAGSHLAVSLAAFNVGVELGQLAVLAVMLPALYWLFSRVMAERVGTVLLSAIVGHTAWHWMTERGAVLRQYRFTWPVLDALFVADVMRALAVAIVLGAAAWAVSGRVGRWLAPSRPNSAVGLLLAAMTALGVLVSPHAARAQGAQQRPLRSTASGVYTAEQAQGGRDVFVAQCTGCHTSASHTGAAFTAKWMGRPLSELFGFVSQRMPKATPGSLSEEEYVLVVAYVLKINGMPAGRTELTGDPDDLNAIRFDSTEIAPKQQGSGRAGPQRNQAASRATAWPAHAGPTRNAMEQR